MLCLGRARLHIHPRVPRIYQRVSTSGQDLSRQQGLVVDAEAAGFYVAPGFRKRKRQRCEQVRAAPLVADVKEVDVVISESLDRISQLPVADGGALIARITERVAKTGGRTTSSAQESRPAVWKWPKQWRLRGAKPDIIANAEIIELRALGYDRQGGCSRNFSVSV